MLQTSTKEDFLVLIDIWERSVRATHDFLPEAEINELKPLILKEYFQHVLLHKYVNEGRIVGFIGTSSDNIEMLFIEPDFRGQGIGKALTLFAIEKLNIQKVDVNEQNPQAIGFYQKLGFKIISRSELDGQGKAYPLLHLQISASI